MGDKMMVLAVDDEYRGQKGIIIATSSFGFFVTLQFRDGTKRDYRINEIKEI